MAKKRNSRNDQQGRVPASKASPAGTYDGSVNLFKNRMWMLGVILLAVASAIVYSPVRHHDFVNYDDGDYVLHNSHVQSGLTLESVQWALTAMTASNWHPLTWMSHAVDCEFFGLDPAGHHLTNVGLHVLNALPLAWLLAIATGAPLRSLLVAALFALHPLNVESVAWAAERKSVLSTLFFLLALGAYGRYARKPSVGRYLLLVAVFVLALASKPMVVTLPFVLLLMDYWPLRRVEDWIGKGDAHVVRPVSFSRCVLEKIPLVVLSIGSSMITVIAQRSGGAVRTLEAFPIWVRVGNAVYAYILYLWKAVLPIRLAVFYPHPGYDIETWRVAVSLLLLLGISWASWKARSFAPYLVVGWLWFLGTLVPVIGVVQVGAQAMADRYAYIPLIGVFVAVVWGVADLCDRYRIKAVIPGAASVAILIAFSWMTWRQLAFWNDSYTLWSHALQVTSDNPVSETQLGMALIAIDRQADAMKHFQTAISLGTHDPTSYLNLGAYLNEHGRQKDAVPLLEAALSMNKDAENSVLAHLNLGFAYTSIGDYPNARLHYRASLDIDSQRVEVVIQGLAQFVSSHPSARDYMKLALMLEEAGANSEAEVAYERILQIDPRNDTARAALAALRAGSAK